MSEWEGCGLENRLRGSTCLSSNLSASAKYKKGDIMKNIRPFTIRDIDCEKIISCNDGDLILQHCIGDLLFLYYGYNSFPKKVEFNLRLSKELISSLKGGKMTDLGKLKAKRSVLINALEGQSDPEKVHEILELIRQINIIISYL